MKKIAMAFLLATVLLQIITMNVEAVCTGIQGCTADSQCANNPPCKCGEFPTYKACCGEYGTSCDQATTDSCCYLRSCQLVSSDYKCRCIQQYDDVCDPNYPNSCCKEENLLCTQVRPDVYKCKDEVCEEHSGHECYPGLFECCEDSGLSCVSVGGDNYQCM